MITVENAAKTTERRLKRRRFKKVPDEPPESVIKQGRASSKPFPGRNAEDI
jgi:hypothetical protein